MTRIYFIVLLVFFTAAPEVFSIDLPAPNLAPKDVRQYLTGVRPYRRTGVRIEKEVIGSHTIVHNYGHGGAGLTLSWGSAKRAADLVESIQAKKDGRIAVLGAGVVGLTTALELRRRGFDVTIYSDKSDVRIVSNIAGGLFAPVMVGKGDDRSVFDQMLVKSFDAFKEARSAPVQEIPYHRLILSAKDEAHNLGLNALVEANRIEEPKRVVVRIARRLYTAIQTNTLLIDTPFYLKWLMGEVQLKGVRIQDFRLNQIEDLEQIRETLIVNATGLGAARIFNDREMIPVGGQLVKLRPAEGLNYLLSAESFYMFPRRGEVILGGTYDNGDASWRVNPQVCGRILGFFRELYHPTQ